MADVVAAVAFEGEVGVTDPGGAGRRGRRQGARAARPRIRRGPETTAGGRRELLTGRRPDAGANAATSSVPASAANER